MINTISKEVDGILTKGSHFDHTETEMSIRESDDIENQLESTSNAETILNQ